MKKLMSVVPIAMAALIVFIVTTVSWLVAANTVFFPNSFQGSTKTAYFAGGDGSKLDPYIIKEPVHFYNLAWLQYLGYFNLRGDLNNGRAQSFFKLEFGDGVQNLDMRGLAIPPIGTSEYPFIGKLNGNGKTISNFTVSNRKSDLIKRPLAAKFTDAETAENSILEISKTRVDSNKQVDIVGLFGVTGDYKAFFNDSGYANKTVNNVSVNVQDYNEDGKTLVSFPAENVDVQPHEIYYSGMKIHDFYVDKVRVTSNSQNTLVGLVAGYVSSTVENVGVYRSKINLMGGGNVSGVTDLTDSTSASVTYDGTVSRYSIVGDYDPKIVGWSENPSPGNLPGGEGGWGGSIDMKSLYNRLNSLKNAASGVDTEFNDVASDGNYRYYDEKKGSVYLARRSGSTVHYLYGGKIKHDHKEDVNNVENGFYISTINKGVIQYLTINYLSTNGAVRSVTDKKKAVTWYYDETQKSIYAYSARDKIYRDKIYLNMSGGGITQLSTAQTVNWTKEGNNLFKTDVTHYGKIYTYYLQYSSNQWKGAQKSADTVLNDLNFEDCGNFRRYYNPTYIYKGNVTSNGATIERNFATYLPLLVDENNDVLDRNTGYISSGSTTIENNRVTGDVRVKRDELKIALKTSLNNQASYGEGKTLKIYTYNNNGLSNFTDTYGSATNGIQKGFTKYEKAKTEGLDPILNNEEHMYGLHFMNAPINIDNVYTADKVKINRNDNYDNYDNYPMIANSIDFFIKSRGLINFFACTNYNGEEKNFFSLHKITRAEDNTITEIKEISKIYENRDGEYFYTYKNENNAVPVGYQMVFDCAWITEPEIVYNALYYFEIPVNDGEYALGSASTGAGAYLMYLDIGANGHDGGSQGPSETLPYIMRTVDFVSLPAADTTDTLTVPTSGFLKYKDAGLELKDVTADSTVWYKRAKYDSEPAADNEIETVVYFWINGRTLTVVPTPSAGANESENNATWA